MEINIVFCAGGMTLSLAGCVLVRAFKGLRVIEEVGTFERGKGNCIRN